DRLGAGRIDEGRNFDRTVHRLGDVAAGAGQRESLRRREIQLAREPPADSRPGGDDGGHRGCERQTPGVAVLRQYALSVVEAKRDGEADDDNDDGGGEPARVE